VFHNLKDDGTASQDTLPGSVSALNNPVFNSDFTIIVTDDAILSYTTAISQNSSSYSVLFNVSFAGFTKKVWRNADNFIIFDEKLISGETWSFIVQVYKFMNASFAKKIGDFSEQIFGKPSIVISPKLMKVIVSGKSLANSSIPYYFAKTINYKLETIKDIDLTDKIKLNFNEIAINDNFVYARNKGLPTINHYAYLMMGKTLI